VSLRGELYFAMAHVAGSEWRARLREIKSCPPEEIGTQSLSRLLEHAVTNVPYYRDLGVSDHRLEAFPLLTRRILRSEYDRLKSDDLGSRRCNRASTGGSTGDPVWIIQDRSHDRWNYATDKYYLEAFHGMPYGEYFRSRRVSIWHRRRLRSGIGVPTRLAVKMLGQVVYLEPYSVLTEKRMTGYLQTINRHRPTVVIAFAGTAFELAKHAKRRGIEVHSPRFVMVSVETLYPSMRRTIAEVFGCPVYNRYGSVEAGFVAGECPRGKLHVFPFANHVEILDPNGEPTAPGAVGRIVVTPLHNLAMPLIRYDIGDLARVSSGPCDCGSALPTLDEVTGRVVEHFVRPDGGLVFGGNFIAMFYEHDWIGGFHVLQEDLDRIRIFYTKAGGARRPEGAIADLNQVVRRVMGPSCRVAWEEVDAVPKSPIGKHLHTRSLVWEEQAGIPTWRETPSVSDIE
jgi:phenylacetate-CoA ligase